MAKPAPQKTGKLSVAEISEAYFHDRGESLTPRSGVQAGRFSTAKRFRMGKLYFLSCQIGEIRLKLTLNNLYRKLCLHLAGALGILNQKRRPQCGTVSNTYGICSESFCHSLLCTGLLSCLLHSWLSERFSLKNLRTFGPHFLYLYWGYEDFRQDFFVRDGDFFAFHGVDFVWRRFI